MPLRPFPAALAIALLCGTAAPASAGGRSHCGGFIRQIGPGDVELAVRERRIEVRLHNENGAPLDATASAAFASARGSERITLTRAAPGLLIGEASETITARAVTLRLAFEDGVVGAARFPVRSATCAAPAVSTTH